MLVYRHCSLPQHLKRQECHSAFHDLCSTKRTNQIGRFERKETRTESPHQFLPIQVLPSGLRSDIS